MPQIGQTLSDQSRGEDASARNQIGQTVSGESDVLAISARLPLPWSHYVELLGLKNELARRFYEAEAHVEQARQALARRIIQRAPSQRPRRR